MLSAVEETSASSRASAKPLTGTVQMSVQDSVLQARVTRLCPDARCIPETSTHSSSLDCKPAVGLPARDHQTLVQDCYANHKQESVTSL